MYISEITQNAKLRDNCISEALDIFMGEVASALPNSMHCIDTLPNIIDDVLGQAYDNLLQAPKEQYNLGELVKIIEAKDVLESQELSYNTYDREEAGIFLEKCASCLESAFCPREVFHVKQGAEICKVFETIIKIAEEYKANAEPAE